MKCSKCNRDAIIFQRYSGRHLCRQHFVADVEGRAKKTIRKHRWIASGDHIAVALSGGKDSTALLYFLVTHFSERRDLTISAITIDEGISGYRNPGEVQRIAASMGVECRTASFLEEYETTLDAIVKRHGDRLSCSYCGVLRRSLINRIAREEGITKIALGFNLDDEAQSVLMNVLRGDADRLVRPRSLVEGLIPRIRPFQVIPEREVALYARLHVPIALEQGCPYSHNALRADVRRMLNDYSYRHPATRYALLNLGEELPLRAREEGITGTICPECGEPCR
ncbi:MAG: adenine nucleotide alpha hydrolase family protein, partial [Methanomicrobiales archaeon]|nr:adenine nucleotide alpha hydrolase family protein [Methanomicrobiales archaeon]